MVRELSKHQSAFLFDCCIVIARFASLSCYSPAKTRIRPVKSYQINESFCSITRCALLRIVYSLIAVSMRFQCPELQVCPLSLPHYCIFEPEPEPDDRIPSTNPGAEPPRDARDSGSARSHSTHLETSSSDRP